MTLLVKDIINYLIPTAEATHHTVDTLKFGNENTPITGIAVTFMPTYEAIERTLEQRANLLICHEGLFYKHLDDPLPTHDKVYQAKKQRIEETNLNIFRLHDYIHRVEPDQITYGLIAKLEWQPYIIEHKTEASIISLPKKSLYQVITDLKDKLNLSHVRYTGNLNQSCQRIGLFVGYRGGSHQTLSLINQYNLDLVICGEGPEWETPEYIRDARYVEGNRGLIVIGHMESEEPGMRVVAQQLSEAFQEVPVFFIRNKTALSLI
ncbi:Nif3-like dinuclear metal center hexameric protein [Amphibacillus cookii]|uniref:Nif3-like dinuclear metal center hexameric protein n=1 Tax=Amphibacillus cookii TaxID=767787 RepID=UPI00195F0AB6|nr:Nif3-like dinuclear metal center hexameric protein [Amphibacillus cookii]MBM7542645.1 putative NIF3 family GTP cyclohydrolase 1 type 2 [Amphibacillus cookii]